MFVPRSPWCMHSYWVWLVFFPEHHACSEAQFYLLKEMTQTFPRVKRQKKREKISLKYYMVSKLGTLWNHSHWWSWCREDSDLKWFWWSPMWCRCIASGPARASADFWRGCGEASVTVHGGHLAHNLNYVECQSESFHLFKTWTSIFYS